MRIEEGKTYVDENGKKAGPLIGGSFKYIAGRGGADDPEWDNDGTIRIEGEEGYGNLVAEWVDHTSPVRTETVTVRRLEPGVYGPLRIWGEIDIPDCERPDETPVREVEVSFAATNIDENGIELRSINASEWRELARVALEIAEYLDAQ